MKSPSDFLRHRYPFLLLDRVVKADQDGCLALKNISINEPFFQGHFPDQPIVPGVLLIEMMAQCAALIPGEDNGETPAQSGVLAQVQSVKFVKPALPGDQLRIEVKPIGRFGSFSKFDGKITCDDSLIVKGQFTTSS